MKMKPPQAASECPERYQDAAKDRNATLDGARRGHTKSSATRDVKGQSTTIPGRASHRRSPPWCPQELLTRPGSRATAAARAAHDAWRIRREVAGVGAEGALCGPGTLHRPVPTPRRADARRCRPHRRALLLRTRGTQRHRRRRLGGRVEAPLLRVGVQGQARQPRHRVQPAAPVRTGAREPAAPHRLRHGAVPNPHELDKQHQRHPRVRARRSHRRARPRQTQVGDFRPRAAPTRREPPSAHGTRSGDVRGSGAGAATRGTKRRQSRTSSTDWSSACSPKT